MRKAHLLVTLALVCCTTYTMACTNFFIHERSNERRVDNGHLFCRLPRFIRRIVSRPAQDWPAGSMLDVYEWDTGKFMGKIPQVAHTYNVVGNMNEHQLAIPKLLSGDVKNWNPKRELL